MIDLFSGGYEFTDENLRIRGRDIPVKRGFVNQSDLSFYPENPRIYTLVMSDNREPSQADIFKQLSEMDHVKKLIKSIELNVGLIEPIIVRNGDCCVLEGNSRLAAFRNLNQQDPLTWSEIECKVLPENVSDSAVFSLLGEYHLIGKKDWAPFEQAGYLYRRLNKHSFSLDELAEESPLTKREISHYIKVYEYMIDVHEADISKWSYYDSFIRSRTLKSATKKHQGLEAKIVRMIKNDDFPRASDLRDKLPKVLGSGNKLVNKLIANEISFEEAIERVEEKGVDASTLRRIRQFRELICDVETGDEIEKLSDSAKSDCRYELNRIRRRIKAVLDSTLKQ